MSMPPNEALAWAVKEMELHAAEVRQLVDRNLAASEPPRTIEDFTQFLMKIKEMAEWIEKVAMQCAEVVDLHVCVFQLYRGPTCSGHVCVFQFSILDELL
jgi:hypothetical protein